MNVACIIPVGPGREENVRAVVKSVVEGTMTPSMIVLVCDGEDAWIEEDDKLWEDQTLRLLCNRYGIQPVLVHAEKHTPGKEQPRNRGVRAVEETDKRNAMLRQGSPTTHAWFLDSDCLASPGTLAAFEAANVADAKHLDKRILIGPYDWLARDFREIPPLDGNENPGAGQFETIDPRWAGFRDHPPSETLTGDLSAGLACFSGNLVWPIDLFTRVGGFWNEIHHGRCEDGELGLRAVQMGIPIGFVEKATAFHLWHPRNIEWVLAANERDVPMLNERHPWVEGRCTCGHQSVTHREGKCNECKCSEFNKAIFEVQEDGARFNVGCPDCYWTGNSIDLWEHQSEHRP